MWKLIRKYAKQTQKVVLDAPPDYYSLTPKQKKKICNGCGPKNPKYFGGHVIPDNLYGISISEACNIHDYMYYIGKTIKDKNEADRVFLNNMLRIIDSVQYPWWLRWLKWLRQKSAWKYYEVVSNLGDIAFWRAGKKKRRIKPYGELRTKKRL